MTTTTTGIGPKNRDFAFDPEETCVICITELGNERGIIDQCSLHKYHYNCIRYWLRIAARCPLCRVPAYKLLKVSKDDLASSAPTLLSDRMENAPVLKYSKKTLAVFNEDEMETYETMLNLERDPDHREEEEEITDSSKPRASSTLIAKRISTERGSSAEEVREEIKAEAIELQNELRFSEHLRARASGMVGFWDEDGDSRVAAFPRSSSSSSIHRSRSKFDLYYSGEKEIEDDSEEIAFEVTAEGGSFSSMDCVSPTVSEKRKREEDSAEYIPEWSVSEEGIVEDDSISVDRKPKRLRKKTQRLNIESWGDSDDEDDIESEDEYDEYDDSDVLDEISSAEFTGYNVTDTNNSPKDGGGGGDDDDKTEEFRKDDRGLERVHRNDSHNTSTTTDAASTTTGWLSKIPPFL